MRKSFINACMFYALTLALLAGCSNVKAPISGRADPHFSEQIHFTDEDLRGKTAIAPVSMERRNGILYVTVPIRSTTNKDLHIDYRVTFFNELGTPIEDAKWMGGTTLAA